MNVLLLTLLLYKPLVTSSEPVLPEPYAGKKSAIMITLYPQWDPTTGRTGVDVDGKPQSVKLDDARLWELKGRKVLAVLVQTWSGDLCKGPACGTMPFDVAAFEWTNNKLTLLGVAREAFRAADASKVAFDVTVPRVERTSMFLGVRDEAEKDGQSITTLRLLTLDKSLKVVFTRPVREARASQKAVDAGCLAILSTDDLEAAPYPIKVTERCQQTKRKAVELWRWQGSEYRLHGPASNAAEDDVTEDENEQ